VLLYSHNHTTRKAVPTNKKFTGERPVYLQIVEDVTLRITSGELPPGGRLAPVRELAMRLGVNPNTVQRAFAELERRGLVTTPGTAGRFVAEDAPALELLREEQAQRAADFYAATMRRLGYTPDAAAGRIMNHPAWTEKSEDDNAGDGAADDAGDTGDNGAMDDGRQDAAPTDDLPPCGDEEQKTDEQEAEPCRS